MKTTVAESATVDYLSTIVLNAVADDDEASINTEELHELRHWTIDIPYGMSLDEYIERLEVATVALAQPTQQIMLKAAPQPHSLLHVI